MLSVRFSIAALLGFVLTACTGAPLAIPTEPVGPDEQALGPAEGRSTGIMLFQCIPIGQNDRFGSAYRRAVASQPGATRLAEVTIQENWFWAWILNGYKFRVTGTAVGPKQH